MRNKKLRSGFTTGACAAAAAKAAAILLLGNSEWETENGKQKIRLNSSKNYQSSSFTLPLSFVDIPFPDGSRHTFRIQKSGYRSQNKTAYASIIKDAGDDPDITNTAEIEAEVKWIEDEKWEKEIQQGNLEKSPLFLLPSSIILKGGKGVGIVTRPGLPVSVGKPAINPVPRKMIEDAVKEAILEIQNQKSKIKNLEITISAPDGETLAKKTLNSRLGIIGGISILGTTGIVKPISTEAWTATITASMDVAKAMGHDEIVLSTGRSSESAHMKKFGLPEEMYVMMGDYLEYALLEAKKHDFKKIHLNAQWAKMLKIAMSTPQTHVRHGSLDTKKAIEFLNGLGIGSEILNYRFNTAMEIFQFIESYLHGYSFSIFSKVCIAAKNYAEKITGGVSVISYLVSYDREIIAYSE